MNSTTIISVVSVVIGGLLSAGLTWTIWNYNIASSRVQGEAFASCIESDGNWVPSSNGWSCIQ